MLLVDMNAFIFPEKLLLLFLIRGVTIAENGAVALRRATHIRTAARVNVAISVQRKTLTRVKDWKDTDDSNSWSAGIP